MGQRAAIILAAGQGTRMKSSRPKVLHEVAGRAMLDWSIALAESVGCAPIVVVTSPGAPAVAAHVEARLGRASVAIQDPALGTGHAVRCGLPALDGFEGDVVVLYGDTPLIPADAVERLFQALDHGDALGVLGFEAADPGAYGRLVQNEEGDLEAIVEASEATPDQLAITLCNSGVMAGRADTLSSLLMRITNDNAKGEYYLTDAVGLARADGLGCRVAVCSETDVLGVNSRVELAAAEAAFQASRRRALMEAGVTMQAPETVYLSHDTQIAPDVLLEPHIVFGPGVSIASGARIRAFSHIEGAQIGEACEVGPYARLRPGAVLEASVKIGNFVELKKTHMARGAKANHLAYLGDGRVGEAANIGAGTIFCNYDGYTKNLTEIGAGAFIGSNSALVAPVQIGEGAYVGSGSVITGNVAADALSVARARQVDRPGWAAAFRARMSALLAGKGKD